MCVWFLQVQAASVLFVDNPVGTGFSYTDSPDAYATDVATVASDMLVLLENFFKQRPEFQVCVSGPRCSEDCFHADVFNLIDLFFTEHPLPHLL